MNAVARKLVFFLVSELEWKEYLNGSENSHDPNASCNKDRRKQLALDFISKHSYNLMSQ